MQKKRFYYLDYYLYISLMFSMLMWLKSYSLELSLLNIFFPSCLVFLNFMMIEKAQGYLEILQRDGRINIFFLAQSFCILSIGAESISLNQISLLYLSLTPVLFGLFLLFKSHFLNSGFIHPKAFVFMAFYFVTQRFITSQWVSPITQVDYQVFLFSTLLSFGSIYLLGTLSMLERKEMMIKLRKSKGEGQEFIPVEDDDRMFYHDLINHTHGILLFLENKKHKQQAISDYENSLVIKEIKSIQTMLSDHFGQSHRNLLEKEDLVTFESAKDLVEKTIFNYLNPENVYINYRGYLQDGFNKQGQCCMVYWSYFSRILTNLVKNVKDHGKSEVCEFIFDSDDLEFSLILKNKIFNIAESQDLSEDLKNQILASKEDASAEGIGLDSVSTLAKLLGGEFHFTIEQGHWISTVKIKAVFKDFAHTDDTLRKVA